MPGKSEREKIFFFEVQKEKVTINFIIQNIERVASLEREKSIPVFKSFWVRKIKLLFQSVRIWNDVVCNGGDGL